MLQRGSHWIQVMVILLNIAMELESYQASWGETQLFPHHLIPDNALNPRRSIVRRKIVVYHNFFRTKVRPTASNMLLMSWHSGAARKAQDYADKCIFLQHNPAWQNAVPNLGNCGQNLFVAAQKTPWFFALKTWFLEYRNFTYGDPNYPDIKAIGHYTQMVWATTHKVGCGVAHCNGGPWGHFWNYVCHYCPGGNYEGIVHYPYKNGLPCDDCRDSCLIGGLCTNSCNTKDLYSNCKTLVQMSRDTCNQGYCNATCTCKHEIHKNYPWV